MVERAIGRPRPRDQRTVFIEGLDRCHRADLLRFASSLVYGNMGRAEDVVQETFLRATKHADHLMSGDPDKIKAWLLTVVRHFVIDGHRRRAARPEETLIADFRDNDKIADTPDLEGVVTDRVLISEGMQGLSPIHREALQLTFWGGLSNTQVAERLGIPLGTAKRRIALGMAALRQDLARRGFNQNSV